MTYRPKPIQAMTGGGGWVVLLAALTVAALPTFAADQEAEPKQSAAWDKLAPASIDDLRAIQTRLQAKLPDAKAATVGVLAGGGSGSGVIVSKDGYVLTAAHVSGAPNTPVRIVLPGGEIVKGKSLGTARAADAGIIKIEDAGDYPFVPMGKSQPLKAGQWCFAIGHPGGYDKERGPVVRLGRMISRNDNVVWSDCKLLGGDSGGPLFDLDGNVIGIHSRISSANDANFHAPIDAYTRDWVRLVAGEVINPLRPRVQRDSNAPFLGVAAVAHEKGALVERVVDASSAKKAGIKVGDVITHFGDDAVKDHRNLIEHILKHKINDRVNVRVIRNGKTVDLDVKLGRFQPRG